MKYIDADKLIAEIERRKIRTERRLDNIVPIKNKDTVDEEQLARIELRHSVDKAYLNGIWMTLYDLLAFITPLQQEQPEVDLEKLGGIARHLIAVKYHEEDMRLDDGEWLLIERIGYPERFSARKEE